MSKGRFPQTPLQKSPTVLVCRMSEQFNQLFSSNWPFLVLIVMVVALIILLRIWTRPRKLPYFARERLVTKTELRFFRSLRKAVQSEWEIFAMVRIADLLRVEKNAKNKRAWINKILAKHIDFVICDRNSLKPLLCIELDDSSHERPDRVERDKFVNEAFESAELPLIRVPVSDEYSPSELRSVIRELI